MLVRLYDYIIGRINGKFFQSDPSFYRRNKRTQKDVSGSTYHQDKVISDVQQNAGIRVWKWKTATCKITNIKTSFYPQFRTSFTTSHKPDDVKSPDTVEKTSERMLKLRVEKN